MRPDSVAVCVALLAAAASSYAQNTNWPQRPVRMVVPFAPGGGTDIVARLIAPSLHEAFGQPFIVDNRGGAGGTLGGEILARATPDGYTISLISSSYSTSPALYDLRFDPIKDVAAIGMTNSGPFFITLHPSIKAETLKDFVALARAQPGKLHYGSSGIGGTPHLAGELLAQMTNTQLVHVPYKGTGPAVLDLLGGRIQFTIANGPSVLHHIKAGKLRAIAVTTEQRVPSAPELPTVNESFPGYIVLTWHGMLAPAGTPKSIVSRLNQAMEKILTGAEVRKQLESMGSEPTLTSPEAFMKRIAEEIVLWTKVVKVAKVPRN
jgi:tripartite-type tricarboxylate transporter receptor subunit TctC